MSEKKQPVRKKGRAQTVMEDLASHGLRLCGVSKKDGIENMIPIDTDDPYKGGGVFKECDFYRVFTSDGRIVIDKRRLSGIRKWIDSGEIEKAEEIAKKQAFDKELKIINRALNRLKKEKALKQLHMPE